MKVALIDNMNNNFFCIVRYLRDMGIDAHLFYYDLEYIKHFHPKSDTFGEEYKSYCHHIKWTCHTSPYHIRNVLSDYDFLIGCGYTPSFMKMIDRYLDIIVPYSADIQEVPFFEYPTLYKIVDSIADSLQTIIGKISPLKYKLTHYGLRSLQASGIRESKNMLLAPTNPEYEAVLGRLSYQNNMVRHIFPMVYTPLYNDSLGNYSHLSQSYNSFLKIREAHDTVVFHHTRHLWQNFPSMHVYKANDKLIKAFAEFVISHPREKSCLIMFEYGNDVEASKNLVKSLGIEKNVYWFSLIPRKEIMMGISMADIGATQFGRSWLYFGGVLEFLAMGKPFMGNRQDSLYQTTYPELYPIMQSSSKEDIISNLSSYIKDKQLYVEIGKKGRQWHQKYAVDKPMEAILKLIQEKDNAQATAQR